MTEPDCPFCKRITAGQYDYFDNYCVAFQPLNPVTPGHFLVVPLAHFSNVFASPVAAGHALKYAGFLANQMGLPAANFITSAGKDATQTVFHLHVHVVPRREGDGLLLPWSAQPPMTEIECYESDLKPGDVIVASKPGSGPWTNYTVRRPTATLDGSERMYGGLDYFDAKAENDAAGDVND